MAKTEPILLTQAEYARSRRRRELSGGTREAVRKAVDEGRISAFGPRKLIDEQLADSQWERNTRTRVSPNQQGTNDDATAPAGQAPTNADAKGPAESKPEADPGYMQFRVRREQADAEIAEMNAAKMRGAMLMREDIDRAFYEIGRELRDRLIACGRRLAAEVASISSAEACEAVIDREHRIVLEQLVAAFREKVGTPARLAYQPPATFESDVVA